MEQLELCLISEDVFSEYELFWNLLTRTEPKDYNAFGEMEKSIHVA